MLKTKDSSTEKIVETLNLYFHYVIRSFSVVDGILVAELYVESENINRFAGEHRDVICQRFQGRGTMKNKKKTL